MSIVRGRVVGLTHSNRSIQFGSQKGIYKIYRDREALP
jgi:hypothetical protein